MKSKEDRVGDVASIPVGRVLVQHNLPKCIVYAGKQGVVEGDNRRVIERGSPVLDVSKNVVILMRSIYEQNIDGISIESNSRFMRGAANRLNQVCDTCPLNVRQEFTECVHRTEGVDVVSTSRMWIDREYPSCAAATHA